MDRPIGHRTAAAGKFLLLRRFVDNTTVPGRTTGSPRRALAPMATAGRLELMLSELRLPTVRRLASQVCTQSDREGWPAHRLLEALLEDELAEREQRRLDRHRAESGLSPDKRLPLLPTLNSTIAPARLLDAIAS
jgi:hypothetical protein